MEQRISLGISTDFPSPLYVDSPDQLTEAHLTYAFQEQLKTTAHVCIDALTYYSDSIVDPVTAAADALNALNYLYYDSDLDGFRRWLTETNNEANTDYVHNYCSEGLADWAYRQHERFCAECAG